jgi:hypothetical protein
MSNCEVFHLKPVFELEQHQVREVLRILLHTVIFNRALGPVKPVERDSELFEITWVSLGERTGAASRAGGAEQEEGRGRAGGQAHSSGTRGVCCLLAGTAVVRSASAAMPAGAGAVVDGGQRAPQLRQQLILAPRTQRQAVPSCVLAWPPAFQLKGRATLCAPHGS